MKIYDRDGKYKGKDKLDSQELSAAYLNCGIGQWTVTIREDHRLRMFENRVLKRIFGPKRTEVIGGWKSCIMERFTVCTLH
jgi:hypothetical protein